MIRLKKVKLLQDELQLKTERTEGGHTFQSEKEVYTDPVHAKFQKALDRMRGHFACVLGYVAAGSVEKVSNIAEDQLAMFQVTGYSITKDDGIILTGKIQVPSGIWRALNTGIIYTKSDVEGGYNYLDEFIKDKKNLDERVFAYLTGNELGVVQGDLNMPEGKPKKSKKEKDQETEVDEETEIEEETA